ncbi:MAG: XkdF-like putative serine protease domain-containing protein [Gemmatimonadota bacterium]|nr:XkdF-like putative serine protease domain-containing protein [Gemmatimonadota bacterium]
MTAPVLRIEKLDEDQRLVGGWASIIEHPDGTPIVDSQGDVILEDDLVEAAHSFMQKSRDLGLDHRIKGVGTVVDSVVFTRDLKKALGLPSSFPTGWYVTAKVDNEEVWQAIKKGELLAFSIGGTGLREPWQEPLAKTNRWCMDCGRRKSQTGRCPNCGPRPTITKHAREVLGKTIELYAKEFRKSGESLPQTVKRLADEGDSGLTLLYELHDRA